MRRLLSIAAVRQAAATGRPPHFGAGPATGASGESVPLAHRHDPS
ncbi:hypothetical protein [Nonomuraea sediminis]|nr:hypothetical protein [Nonomuraea sediminis]